MCKVIKNEYVLELGTLWKRFARAFNCNLYTFAIRTIDSDVSDKLLHGERTSFLKMA